MKEPSFKDFETRSGTLKVVWEWIGEGFHGDYNPDDSKDVPLLRFTCLKKTGFNNKDGAWEQMDDASYCTLMPIDSPKKYLKRGAEIILNAIKEDKNYKKRLEELSWFCIEDFEKKSKNKV